MSENNNLNTLPPSDDIYAGFTKHLIEKNNFNFPEVDKDLIDLSKEEISNMIQKIFSPSCSKCGKCCTDVLMATDQEIKKVKEYIKKYNIKPVNRNTIFDKEQKNICPFLNKDNICLIYPVRLKMCQRFFCGNRKEDNGLETYKNVKVISMIQTFFPDEFMTNSPFDLTYENLRLKNFQEKIYHNP